MKTEHRLGLVSTVLVALLIVVAGCGKGKLSSTTLANSVSNKLAAITQAGQPVTGKDLDDCYPTPPDADNAAPLYASAFAVEGVGSWYCHTIRWGANDSLNEAAERSSAITPIQQRPHPLDIGSQVSTTCPPQPWRRRNLSSEPLAQEDCFSPAVL